MGAGDYRKRVTLEQPIRTTNELGEQEISWQPLMDVWVNIKTLTGREVIWARQAQLQTDFRVRCRWFATMSSQYRLTWFEPDGTKRILNILDTTDIDERHIEWELSCKEVTRG